VPIVIGPERFIAGLPLSEIARRLHERSRTIWLSHDRTPMGSICHYTSLEAFHSMVQSRVFWLSDMSTMNDKSEVLYFNGILRPIISRKSVPTDIAERLLRNNDLFGSEWFGYAVCFCRTSDKLEQWDRYASNGHGVGLCFDAGLFALESEVSCGYSLVPMIYDPNQQRLQTEKVVDSAIQLSRELSVPKRSQLLYWAQVVGPLLQCAIRFKHPAFSGEEEARSPLLRIDRDDALSRRTEAGTSRLYVEAPIPFSSLNGVILGPRATVTVAEVRDTLEKHGLSIPVDRSTIPLR
jgi:hypothetical protein